MEYFGDLIKFVKSHICKLNQTIIPFYVLVVSYSQESAKNDSICFFS
jgi:hypothetical protein